VTDERNEGWSRGTWAALRRRKVVQWGLAYSAGAWGLLQGLVFLVDAFHWPDATKQAATFLLLTGLPVAMLIAWFHGDLGQQRVTRLELALLTAVVAIGALLTVWWFRAGSPQDATVAGPPAPAAAPAPRSPPRDLSIAVLPFVNMSSDEEQEYFADGLSEELLNLLAKTPGLRVIGRTSSFQFKGRNEDLRVIGQKLGVAHLLEGSVRRSGGKLRITAQLIRAEDGSHLWSDTYDRGIEDIFAVQDEIAGEVAAALQVLLAKGESVAPAKGATSNLNTYDMYLEGRYLFNTRTVENVGRGLELLQAVTERDPDFAEAQATFAVAVVVSRDYPRDLEALIPIMQAERAARRALELDPSLAEAHAALGMIHASRLDWESADAQYREALRAEPYNGMVNMWYGNFLRGLGRTGDAVKYYETARHYDPQSAVALGNLALAYVATGRAGESEQLLTAAAQRGMRHPTFCHARIALGTARHDPAMVQSALAEWFAFFPSWMPQGAETILARAALDPSARPAARSLLADAVRGGLALESWATLLVTALAGDFDTAFASAARVSPSGSVSLGSAFWHPSLAEWRGDPRFKRVVRRLQMPEYWRKAGWPDWCRPVGGDDFECRG